MISTPDRSRGNITPSTTEPGEPRIPVSPDERTPTLRQYLFLCLLTFINVVNLIDRQLLSSFANFIVPDLGLTNTQFGLLTGMLFMVSYSVTGLVMGALADIVHRPRLVAAAVALWSILTAASGAARGFVGLYAVSAYGTDIALV